MWLPIFGKKKKHKEVVKAGNKRRWKKTCHTLNIKGGNSLKLREGRKSALCVGGQETGARISNSEDEDKD